MYKMLHVLMRVMRSPRLSTWPSNANDQPPTAYSDMSEYEGACLHARTMQKHASMSEHAFEVRAHRQFANLCTAVCTSL